MPETEKNEKQGEQKSEEELKKEKNVARRQPSGDNI